MVAYNKLINLPILINPYQIALYKAHSLYIPNKKGLQAIMPVNPYAFW